MKFHALAFVLVAGCATDAVDSLSIDVSDQELSVSRGDDHASLTWTESEATLESNGQRATILRTDAAGTWLPVPVASFSTFERAARLIDEAGAVEVPWRTLGATASIADCTTVSTWVRGGSGSCTDCRATAWSEAGGPQGDHTSGSCSQGSLWTTCTHTWCSDSVQMESSLEQ